jgi:hypothetical protein
MKELTKQDAMNVVCAVFLAATPFQASHAAFAVALTSLHDLNLLPLPRDGVSCKMFSSYDRGGGNDDGFKGTYSKLRLEDGNSVIAEMKGAGCITRFWITHSEWGRDGLLNGKGEHIKFYLDGAAEPQIDVPLQKVFEGKVDGFPVPLVGHGTGGFYCYVPIFYKSGCKVVIEGDAMKFYQLTYAEYDASKQVSQSGLNQELNQALVKTLTGNTSRHEGQVISKAIRAKANEPFEIVLDGDSRQVFKTVLEGESKQDLLKGRIQISWDRANTPAIDVPVSHFFAHTAEADSYESLLTGLDENGFYNAIPMPYAGGATIRLTFPQDTEATLLLTVGNAPAGALKTRLHARYKEYLPTKNREFVEMLVTRGSGHVVGAFLDTRSDVLYENGVSRWLEGDEIITVDGELTIHGTGTEDYFNCGWYATKGRLDRPGTYPLHGFVTYSTNAPIAYAAAYRWHLTDPIPFKQSIDIKLEHGEGNNRPADYRSTVFYYLNQE